MSYATTPGMLHLSVGVLIGFGLSGASFPIVLAAFGKILPESWRSIAFGIGTAAGSFGQFLFSPLAVALLGTVGWHQTLLIFAVIVLLVLPLAFVISTGATTGSASAAIPQSFRQALGEAFGHRSYVLLILGFFTCGFHVAFIATHLPGVVASCMLPPSVGAWSLAIIGLFNIMGSLWVGKMIGDWRMKLTLAGIYAARAAIILVFFYSPKTELAFFLFAAGIGFTYLSTVPPTVGLVAKLHGQRYLATLMGLVMLSHQVGGFLGAWLGGKAFEASGNYDRMWWADAALCLMAAAVHLPIREARRAMPAAA
jgi:predicted MFS family arabinose efflux permease